MPQVPKMKDTMRKKPKEPAPDVTSPSSESVSTNPWSDAQSVMNTDLSRQTSKTSREFDSSSSKRISHSPGPSQSLLDATDTASMTSTAPSLKPPDDVTTDEPLPGSLRTRRRKTVNKVTPHTFELADSDLKPTPTKPKESDPATEDLNKTKPDGTTSMSEDQKSDVTNPPNNSLKRRQPRPREAPTTFAYSKVTTTINVKPTKPKPQSPYFPRNANNAPNPFAQTHRRPQSSLSTTATSPVIALSNPVRFDPPSLTSNSSYEDFFASRTVVLTHGASPIGWSIAKFLHAFGARVIMGDTDAAKAKKLIKSLDEPHLVHFQPCDCRRYGDMVDLFRLAVTMYGRVDHAVWGVGEDGGQGVSVGEGERGWFGKDVEREPGGLLESLGAGVRFAHIAMGYLRQGKNTGRDGRRWDRSLTMLTSIASFREMPGLPVYQVAQHGVLGLVRSLRASVDPERDGIRVNAVVTGMMVARAFAGAAGRMSVKLPSDMPEDVGRTVVGVVAAGSAEGGSGIWYEGEKGEPGRLLHGRAIYVIGGECWDIEEGLSRSEQVWLGKEPSEVLNKQQEGIGTGNQWMLDLQ